MNALTDQQLLREYAEHRSETAFTELVRRHVDMVYAASKRMTDNAHSAEDVTQAVFVVLAQNADRLSRHPVLSGWLHTTARNLAAKTVRAVTRRQFREHEAAAMNQHSEDEPAWDDIAPYLDAALGELNEAERDAILLRYFEKKSAAEIAAVIGISTAAAQKRVTRAVEQLRESFARRGVTVGAGGLVLVIGAHAAEAAPIGFAASISTAAVAGSAVPTSTLITTTKAIAMTTLQKSIFAITVATFAGAGMYEARQVSQLRKQNQAFEQQLAPMAQQVQLQNTPDDAANNLASLRQENEQLKSNQTELLKLRGEVGALQKEANDADQRAKAAEQKLADAFSSASLFKGHEAATVNTAKMITLQFHIFAGNHDNQFPTNIIQLRQQMGSDFPNSGIGLFEVINPGTEWSAHPNAVVLRERIAQQAIDGSWERIYAFADGSVQKALSNDGNFEAWEKVNTYSPPPSQNP